MVTYCRGKSRGCSHHADRPPVIVKKTCVTQRDQAQPSCRQASRNCEKDMCDTQRDQAQRSFRVAKPSHQPSHHQHVIQHLLPAPLDPLLKNLTRSVSGKCCAGSEQDLHPQRLQCVGYFLAMLHLLCLGNFQAILNDLTPSAKTPFLGNSE